MILENSPTIAFETVGLPVENAPCLIVWGHGWNQSRTAFKPFAETLSSRATHIVIDFPGFGLSAAPPSSWTTAEYADALAQVIRPHRNVKKIIYVGHSFGGRVGIQLAARHPALVDALFLIGSAGLPRNRSLLDTLKIKLKVYTFKTLKHLAPLLGLDVEKLRGKFGSADYKSAGPMRPLFLRIISENLSNEARKVSCPTHFVYGENDTETPPEVGLRLKNLIANASIEILPNQDHYTVIGEGRHVVIKRLAEFMETLK